MDTVKNGTKLYKIYFWCISYLKRYAVFVFLFIILRLVYELCNIFIPQIIKQFIDRVLTNQEYGVVKNLAMLTIGVVVVMIASYISTRYMDMIFVEKGMRAIQCDVFDRTRIIGFKYFENTPRGETLAILANNVISIYFLYLLYVTQTVSLFLAFTLSFSMIARSKSLIFILILVLSSICVVVLNLVFAKRVDRVGVEQAAAGMDYNRKAYDSIEAFDEIRAFGAGEWNIGRGLSAFSKFRVLSIRMQFFNSIRSNAVTWLKAVAIVVFFLVSLRFVQQNIISIGDVVAYFIYYTMAFNALSQFSNMIYQQNKILYDAEKPYNFMKMEPDVKEADWPVTKGISGAISLENVGFCYNRLQVLKNVSFTVDKGEKVVIVGASGEGKSTLLKLLLRCYDCTEGRILVDGVPISQYSISTLRDSIGIVFQETYLFSMSVMENLRFGNPEATDEEVIEAATLAGAHEFIIQLPNGYDTILDDRGQSLSGGQQQRLSIARGLLKDPQILLLDEITSELDYINESHIIETISTRMKEKTVIMTAHRLSVIKKAPRILVMENGGIVEDGGYEALMERRGYLYRLVSKGIVKDD